MPNRLASESSAYLQQHAAQPVDWHPWGDEALTLARRLDKPILLSIGYAACHWCRVMARESFSDPAIAALMNEGFVNIKVDREERPDLDAVYQMAHQLLRRTGGGWPLTIFLSPQGMPFYSGTYFPAAAPDGQATFRAVLGSVSTVWSEQRPALLRQDQALRQALAASLPRPEPEPEPEPDSGSKLEPEPGLNVSPNPERNPAAMLDAAAAAAAAAGAGAGAGAGAAVRAQALEQLATAFDPVHGGFGAAPKFAHPCDLAFLLARARDGNDAQALTMALTTLRKMAEGGIYDQIGGGFFRYSVDAQWRIPHFEKMLSDNGVLLALYADALALSDEPLLRRVVEDTAGWALREMQAENGGFYASLAAADAQGREGHFYLWESEPLRLALSPNEWDVCAAHWGLVDAPSFEGRLWHLRVARPAGALAITLRRPEAQVNELIASARPKLLIERDKRDAPARDDKLLTGWNALMITGLARAGAVCQRADWLQAARQALDFIRLERWQDDGRTSGRLLALPGQDAFLDDHAFLLEAVLALHEADPQPGDLTFAQGIAKAMLAQFEDREEGGFFFTRHDSRALIHRLKTGVDAATPSGNGTAALALLALADRLVSRQAQIVGMTVSGEGQLQTHDAAPAALQAAHYRAAAARCVRVFAATLRRDPASHTRLLQAAARWQQAGA